MKKDKQLLNLVKDLVELSFADGKIIEQKVTRSIRLLRSLPGSKSIFAMPEYLKGLKRKEREHTLYIESAIPLSAVQINKMKTIVETKIYSKQTGKITKVQVSVNQDLLGGFKLRVGDETWDDTVLGRIEQVKEAIRG